MDPETMRDLIAQARWDAIVSMVDAFLTAAQGAWWLWLALVGWVALIGRRGIARLLIYVGGTFARSELRG